MNKQIISISLAAAATFSVLSLVYHLLRRKDAIANEGSDERDSEIKEKRKKIIDWIGQTPMI